MRTTLEAVNEILERCGEPHAQALDTAGNSDVTEAETILYRARRQILCGYGPDILGGWSFNTDRNITVKKPTHMLGGFALNDSDDLLIIGETLTGGTSGATGVLCWYANSATATDLFIHTVTGTFAALETVTGGTSGFAGTFIGSFATVTEGPIGIPASPVMLSFREFVPDQHASGSSELRIIAQREDRFYDKKEATYDFDEDIVIDRVIDADFEDIWHVLQDVIVTHAGIRFQRWKKKDRTSDAFNVQEFSEALSRAHQEEGQRESVNVLKTPGALNARGRRWAYGGGGYAD